MITEGYIIYDAEGSYMVISNSILPESFGPCTFIAHMEGSPKVLFRLVQENKDKMKGKILFCTKDINYFTNHCKEIQEGLYEFTGKL